MPATRAESSVYYVECARARLASPQTRRLHRSRPAESDSLLGACQAGVGRRKPGGREHVGAAKNALSADYGQVTKVRAASGRSLVKSRAQGSSRVVEPPNSAMPTFATDAKVTDAGSSGRATRGRVYQ